jgi:hypothetical protein
MQGIADKTLNAPKGALSILDVDVTIAEAEQ